jgi:hypothetical protein
MGQICNDPNSYLNQDGSFEKIGGKELSLSFGVPVKVTSITMETDLAYKLIGTFLSCSGHEQKVLGMGILISPELVLTSANILTQDVPLGIMESFKFCAGI